jgi:regulator of cell morphogenesis and NO signaling
MLSSSQSIRDITSKQPSAIAVFERFDIDLCSSADKSLKEACYELCLSLDQVLEKLEDCPSSESASLRDPSALSCADLIQHIVRVYHQGVRQDLPKLVRLASVLLDEGGEAAPAVETLKTLTEQLHAAMLTHIQKEEQVLFPFIVQMEEHSKIAYPPAHACFRSVSHPVFMLVQEHELANLLVEAIRRSAGEFVLPESASPTHVELFVGLRGFEENFQKHIHLENDVLFPRSIQMEAELQGWK